MNDWDNSDWLAANSVFEPWPNHNFREERPSRVLRIFGILCVLSIVIGALVAVNS